LRGKGGVRAGVAVADKGFGHLADEDGLVGRPAAAHCFIDTEEFDEGALFLPRIAYSAQNSEQIESRDGVFVA
jgi:hypothetical protein